MGIGEMDKVVVFKSNAPSAATTGGKIDSYSTLLTTRGKLKRLNGSRGLSFGEVFDSNSYELLVRYQTALASALKTSLRVEIDSVNYAISTYEKIGEKKFYIRFIISEQRS